MTPRPRSLRWITEEYAALENSVRELMTCHAGPLCSSCSRICCRLDICEETFESAFLGLVRALFPPPAPPSPSRGWLTPGGCALAVGRPPVCYEFLCDDIMSAQDNDDARYALRALGMLLTYLGRNALGDRHLVAMVEHETLLSIKPARFEKRLKIAREVLDVIEACLNGGEQSAGDAALLRRVCPPGVELYQGE